MSRNQHRVTHYVGDDCPGSHRELAFPSSACRCSHSVSWHRLVNDISRECFKVGCGCAQYRAQEDR